MDRKAVSIVAVIAVVIAGGLVYTLAGGSSDDSGEGTASAPAIDGAAGQGAGNSGAGKSGGGGNGGSAAAGEYVDYSPELVSSTPGTRLLFFHAPWCPQCGKALESDIESSDLPDGVTIFKVDYDSNQELRQQYGVTVQTTVVEVDRDGNKFDSYVAYEEPTFENVEQALLR